MPDFKPYIRERIEGHLGVRPEREAAIVEELAQQLASVYEEHLASGGTEAEAMAAAHAEIPDWPAFVRTLRESERPAPAPIPRNGRFLQGLWQDGRFAIRALRRSPGLAASCILTLALGIGGCTAVFSLLDSIVLRPIEYRDPEQLMVVWEHNLVRGNKENVVSPSNLVLWMDRTNSFTAMAAMVTAARTLSASNGVPEKVDIAAVYGPFFSILGVHPILGRDFAGGENVPNAPRVVMLSHELWMRRFNGDGRIVGKTIRLDKDGFQVIGVLPAGFRSLGKPAGLYGLLPMNIAELRQARSGRYLTVVGRLRPGVTHGQAQRDFAAVARQLEIERPQANKNWGVNIVPLQDQFSSTVRSSLWILMGGVGLVLLMACANVANLQLARGVHREREAAIRTALGANRIRMIRQLLTESTVLALAGCIAGWGLAYLLIGTFQRFGPVDVPRLDTAGLDRRVLSASFVLALFTALVSGLAPALATTRFDLTSTLKEGARGIAGGRHGVLRAIIVIEVALALVLLTGAGLLLRSFQRTLAVNPGFDPSNVLTMTVNLSENLRELNQRVRELPGVVSASSITFLPLGGGSATSFWDAGQPEPAPGQYPAADVRIIKPRYFETMRIPVIAGRDFTDRDSLKETPLRFIVNETLANTLFPNGNVLGQRLIVRMQEVNKPSEIVGVVGDTKGSGLQAPLRPMVYYPEGQLSFGFASLVIRTATEPRAFVRPVTALIRDLDPEQPVADVRTMEEAMSRSVATQRFVMVLLLSFAALAVFLAILGIYSMLSFAVSQRTHEIGVRLALGARAEEVRWWIAKQGLILTGIGLCAGLAGAYLTGRVLKSFLYGVEPHDPLTIASAAVILVAASALASYLPALRATKVDPMEALRYE